ncbi:uncharacterized protein LOC141812311 [Curcuma longa]|uniref:uncharacterized protein LOC141812311 n=1 Tax=Curcuma longa TaxID=136217 RepID=UPI003D9ED5CF
MQAKYGDKPALKYIKMDVRDMSPFESGSFDAVINKGTLDTLMVSVSRLKLFLFCKLIVEDGFIDVVNIDISSVLIETMQAKYGDKPALKYIKMDVRDMSPFESGSFDAVINKGTLDTLMCGEDDISVATQLLKEVGRVLKDKGAYILITFDPPIHRLHLLRRVVLWNIKLHTLERLMSSRQINWELSAPWPLDRDGSWVTEVLRSQLDLFYVYVCIKDESLSAKQATDTDESLSAKQATDTEIPSSQNDT